MFPDEQRRLPGVEAQLSVRELVLDRVLPQRGGTEAIVQYSTALVQVVALVEAGRVVAE